MLELSWYLGLALAGLATVQGVGALIGAGLRGRRFAQAMAHQQALWAVELAATRAQAERAAGAPAAWNGWRVFEVVERVDEGGGICSLHLSPHDGKPLPPFKPGQYLTFQFRVPGQPRPVVRCYSLSSAPDPQRLRVSIKRVVPHGIASNFVHDQVQRGALLDVRAPAGHFFLDLDSTAPVVLLAGGVGITPLLAMIEAVVQGGTPRELWLFYGVRQPAELMQRPRFEALAREHDWLHLQLCYSDHRPERTGGVVGEHHGRVGVDLLQRLLPANNYEFYICGPPPMMQSLTAGLREWGVPDERVHFEAFGPASVKTATPPTQPAAAVAGGVEVQFARSGKVAHWIAASGSLLELAESVGVPIDSGCRAGNCGSCVVPLRSGAVDYPTPPGYPNEPGTCLSCVARPRGSVVLEA